MGDDHPTDEQLQGILDGSARDAFLSPGARRMVQQLVEEVRYERAERKRLAEVIEVHHADFLRIKELVRRQRDGSEPRLLLEEIDRLVR